MNRHEEATALVTDSAFKKNEDMRRERLRNMQRPRWIALQFPISFSIPLHLAGHSLVCVVVHF